MIYILDNKQPYSSHAIFFIQIEAGDFIDQTDLIEEVARLIWDRFPPQPKVIGQADFIDWRAEKTTCTISDLVDQHWWRFDEEKLARCSPAARETIQNALKPHQKELQGLKEYR